MQIEAANSARIINTAEYLNKKCKDQFVVNIATSDKSYQTNSNELIKTVAKFVEELEWRYHDVLAYVL